MKKILSLLVSLVLTCSCIGAEEWQKSLSGLNETEFNCIAAHPKVKGLLFAGSSKAVYKSIDGGGNWKSVLSIWGAKKKINFILIDEHDSIIYTATENGLYRSLDDGVSWKLAYRGQGDWKNIICLARAGDRLFLGTAAGLIVHFDKVWQRVDSGLPKSKISSIAIDQKNPAVIYLANIQGVFKSIDSAKTWEKVFVSSAEELEQIPEESEIESLEEAAIQPKVRSIAIDNANSELIYLGTEQGVFQSQDAGKTFKQLTKSGLTASNINFILGDNQMVYAATSRGVFVYLKEKQLWQELYAGITEANAKFLSRDPFTNILWLASKEGIFKISTNFSEPNNIKWQDGRVSQEPTINQVQEVAINYAEVEADKIKQWRKKAKMKAILPKLTVGVDMSKNTNYEIYTSATTHYVFEGPDDRSNGWDVTLSWELGDLIWNESQTSIDVRSRLMVQLRNDILDEVNRAYFERRRLQFELLNQPQSSIRWEKELRMQELTANLDALTGGWFSRNIK